MATEDGASDTTDCNKEDGTSLEEINCCAIPFNVVRSRSKYSLVDMSVALLLDKIRLALV